MNTFTTKMLAVYTLTYAPQGVDKVKQRYDGKELSAILAAVQYKKEMQFLSSPLTMMTSFLGLPNRDRGEGQSFGNILKNIVGWEDEPSLYVTLRAKRIALNLLRIIPYAGFNLARALPLTALNILRLGTELIPVGLMAISDSIAGKCLLAKKNPSTNIIVKGLAIVGYPLAYGTRKLFETVGNLGRWLTSPGASINRAHQDSRNSVGIKEIRSNLRNAEQELKVFALKKESKLNEANSKAQDLLNDDKRVKIEKELTEKLKNKKINEKIADAQEKVAKYEKELKIAKQRAVLKTVSKVAIRSPLLIVSAPVSVPLWNISMAVGSINPNRFFSSKKSVDKPIDDLQKVRQPKKTA